MTHGKGINRTVVSLILVAGTLPLLGTTVFKDYAVVLWTVSLLVNLGLLFFVIPRNSLTKDAPRRNTAITLGVLIAIGLAIFLAVANM